MARGWVGAWVWAASAPLGGGVRPSGYLPEIGVFLYFQSKRRKKIGPQIVIPLQRLVPPRPPLRGAHGVGRWVRNTLKQPLGGRPLLRLTRPAYAGRVYKGPRRGESHSFIPFFHLLLSNMVKVNCATRQTPHQDPCFLQFKLFLCFSFFDKLCVVFFCIPFSWHFSAIY